MALYVGNQKIKTIYKGSTLISRLYAGSTLVYKKGEWHNYSQLFTANGSITFPAVVRNVVVTVVGAGGCGSVYAVIAAGKPIMYFYYGGSGGGAGGYSQKNYGSSLGGQTVNFVVGQASASAGYSGGNSSFLNQVAYGGTGGQAYTSPGSGGSAINGDTNYSGQNGTNGALNSYGTGGQGWYIAGAYFGTGGSPNAMNNLPATVSNGIRPGCVYITFDYFA